MSKSNVGLEKKLMQEGLSEFVIYSNLVYKFRKIVGKSFFSVQFNKIVTRYKMICYNIAILRQTASMVIKPIMVDNFVPLFIARRWVGPQTKWRLPPRCVSDGRCMTINVCGRAHRSPICGFLVASDRHWGLCFVSAQCFWLYVFHCGVSQMR